MNYQQNSDIIVPKEHIEKTILKKHKSHKKHQKHVRFALDIPVESQKKYIHYSSKIRRTPKMSGWDIKETGVLNVREPNIRRVQPKDEITIHDDLTLTPPPAIPDTLPVSDSDCVLLMEYFDLARKMDYLNSMRELLEIRDEEMSIVIKNKMLEKEEIEKNIFTTWSEIIVTKQKQQMIVSSLKK